VAYITAMDQPLGMMIGNWLEVVEAVECLKGKNIPDLMELVYVLGGTMVKLGGKAGTIAEGIGLCRSAVWSGRAFEKFLQVVARQGGDASFIRDPSRYPPSACSRDVAAASGGYVTAFATRRIGVLAVELGAGRLRVDDVVDPRAGIILRRKIGDRVAPGETLATIRTQKENLVAGAVGELCECITIAGAPPPPTPCIRSVVDAAGVHAWSTPVVY